MASVSISHMILFIASMVIAASTVIHGLTATPFTRLLAARLDRTRPAEAASPAGANAVPTAHLGSAAAETRSFMESEAIDNLIADPRRGRGTPTEGHG